jgi:glycosyltransferase involved in cell wall biosynthesis
MEGGLRTKGIFKKDNPSTILVSIITVVFNRKTSIERAILSVLDQSYENIEYIIVDGNSTDGTLEIIKKYEDRIDYWISEPDKGMYHALNKGIDLANGDLIGLCHSDDYLFNEDVIEHVVNTHLKINADIYHGDVIISDERNNKIVRIISNSDYITQTHHSIVHPSTFIKRLVFSTIGYYNTTYRSAADYELMIRLKINNLKFHHLGIIVCGMNINNSNRVSVNCYSRLEAYHFHKELKTGNHNQYIFQYIKCILSSFIKRFKSLID